MADEEEKQEKTQEAGSEESKAPKKKSILPWIILGVIIPLFAGAGFGLGRLVAGGKTAETEEVQKEEKLPAYMVMLDESKDGEQSWFYQDIAPVVANLADPGATRFVRVGLMLELTGVFDETAGREYLASKQPLVKNWLAIYLASQRVEDLQGERNLKRVLSEVKDMLNERLFPDASPPIKSVLLSELAIQ